MNNVFNTNGLTKLYIYVIAIDFESYMIIQTLDILNLSISYITDDK